MSRRDGDPGSGRGGDGDRDGNAERDANRGRDADRDANRGRDADRDALSTPELRARVEVLEAELDRLRERYRRSRRSRYRRTAGGLAAVGGVAAALAAAFPTVRSTLVVLAGIGLFGAVLTLVITPERFVAAGTAERVNRARTRSLSEMVDQLGLSAVRVYVPVDGATPARLFVPLHDEYAVPDDGALAEPFVVDHAGDGAGRGLSLVPAGAPLFEAFERTLSEPLGSSPTRVLAQAADALVEAFELAETVETDCDPGDGRATVAVGGSAYGAAADVDDPVASFVAVALARGLDAPVEAEVVDADGDDDLVVAVRWDATERSETEQSAD
ncbi:hypothetical protein Hbl1158_14670 [Halobaculum sp. CBA1158]|uniref:hypothetical protein n=1 Tax=Halobaculum sp. CBA1158 TaxID=2904243 RepID=UPI001F161CA8|nr:hypothetical protein [Halobaculum sp. CBA1158]UIO99744.1 hypothetical protein Hbl1158_14670 [Halobaculum sp. CBA1158]